MKKLAILTAILILIAAVGLPAFSAGLPVKSTTLTSGEAYQWYEGQIEMTDGNAGYDFRFVSGTLPSGLTFAEDGSGKISGEPTSSGIYSHICVLITNTASGASEEVIFSLYIAPRKITVNVTAPTDAVYSKGTKYTADITCADYYTGVDLTASLGIRAVYGTQRLDAAEDAGTYYIRVLTPSGCSIRTQTGDTHLVVAGAGVTALSVKGYSIGYDGEAHGITDANVTLDPTAAGWAVEYLHPGASEYTADAPVLPGTYTARVYTTDPNYELRTATATIAITSKTVNFTVTNNTHDYAADTPRQASFAHDGPDTLSYTVEYIGPDGYTYTKDDPPVKAGVYTIEITITTTGYELGTVSDNTLTISGTEDPVDFTVTLADSYVYNGEKQVPATITPSKEGWVEGEHYTVIYRNAAGEVEDPINAGTYSISISLTDGNLMLGTVDKSSMTIAPLPVKFSGENKTVDYDENKTYTLDLEADTELVKQDDYSITYKAQGGYSNLSAAKNAGIYNATVTFSNSNFTLAEAVGATLTIKAVLTMQPGNSPAAMIYKDATHATDTDWQSAALADLTADSQFDEYKPDGCETGITYNGVGEYQSPEKNPDLNVYTLVVKDTASFTDPGVTVQDGTTTAPLTGTLAATDIAGLYTLTYTYPAAYEAQPITLERYVICVPTKIGDANGDGNTNAVDANYLDARTGAAASYTEARIWDVTMDGNVNKDDAAAIRNRFAKKLVPYYPWIEG